MVASAINISGFSKAIRTYTPDAGEHTDEMLKWSATPTPRSEDMRKKGAI